MFKRFFNAISAGIGVPCLFGSPTGISGDASVYNETTVLQGAAGAVVSLQVTTYTNSNPSGRVTVNGGTVFLNDTFTVTLNGSGNGSFSSGISGNAGAGGTIVRAVFTITGVSIGQLGSPSTHQISKAY